MGGRTVANAARRLDDHHRQECPENHFAKSFSLSPPQGTRINIWPLPAWTRVILPNVPSIDETTEKPNPFHSQTFKVRAGAVPGICIAAFKRHQFLGFVAVQVCDRKGSDRVRHG